jgi:hypothetical protein
MLHYRTFTSPLLRVFELGELRPRLCGDEALVVAGSKSSSARLPAERPATSIASKQTGSREDHGSRRRQRDASREDRANGRIGVGYGIRDAHNAISPGANHLHFASTPMLPLVMDDTLTRQFRTRAEFAAVLQWRQDVFADNTPSSLSKTRACKNRPHECIYFKSMRMAAHIPRPASRR